MEKAKKTLIPGYIGLACVWFGIHCGPGTASGKQAVVYFLKFGKWSLIFPILAMGILGLCIYYSIEFSRVSGSTNFKDFASKLFHPYDKIFANFFEFMFVATVGMSGGASVYTGAHLFDLYLGIPVWVGMAVIAAFTIFFSIYGAALVRSSSSYMSILIFLAMAVLVVLGLAAVGGPANALAQSSFEASPATAGWNAIIYAAFQSTGVIGGVVAVADGLKSRSDSKKATIWGIVINALFLIIISMMLMGFPEAVGADLPNYFVATQLGFPFLTLLYVLIVFLACVTNTIAFSHALSGRYSKFIKTKSPNAKKLVICVVMLVYVSCVSFFGLNAIVGTGFTYLGYASLATLMLPVLIIGPRKIKKMKAETAE